VGILNDTIGEKDLKSASKATPFLYAHLKIDEGAGDILYDSSGNGHNLIWDTRTNATAAAAGVWTANGLEFNATVTNNDLFYSDEARAYPFENPNYTSIYVCQFTPTSATFATNSSLFCARATTNGVTDAGWQWYFLATGDLRVLLHDGTSTNLAVVSSSGVAITANDKMTSMITFDASTNELGMYIVSDADADFVQYYSAGTATPSAAIDESLATAKPALGARSWDSSAEDTISTIFHNLRCYHDTDGGALPNNLGDICRWLHQNPTANIPAEWWS
jgi:hypothetical protein